MLEAPQPSRPGRGFVVAVCHGLQCAAAAGPGGPRGIADDLAAAVRRSRYGVLISTGCLRACAGLNGRLPLVVTHGYRDGQIDRPTGPATWLGPLSGSHATCALRDWLVAGGPGAQPIPATLRPLILPAPRWADPKAN